jgi:DNA-binding FrmR family transcriptional regulator
MVRPTASLPVLDPVFVPDEKKAEVRRRLKRARGQVDGIERMLESNRSCRDILQQIAAAQEALRAAGKIMMRNYLESCVARGIKAGQADIYDEFLDVAYRMVR